jgi:hypothetical protein|tara:strand:- start:764 stop:1198 length:435 start_codon:yes stop_codon:yes gene_type:complete
MKMPISEIIDRYTISKLKSERTNEDVSHEVNSYSEEIGQYNAEEVTPYVEKMYEINGTLWDYETRMRKLMDSRNGTGPVVDANDLPLAEIGKLALLVRDLNGTRNGVKSEIVEKFSEGFKDIKINYVKTDYPVLSNLGLKFEDE